MYAFWKVCAVYTKAVEDGQPPHIVFDTTKNVAVSETVKAFSSALALPTVSTSFGRQGDSNEWRDLSDEKQQYLLQVNPPLDTIPELVRAFVKHQNISNAAILFDDHFGKIHCIAHGNRLYSIYIRTNRP